ncbi:MAG: hypothetical protein KJ950_02245 [Proteobacteria bacterium]|nr:hypothetical protein [Pseudomonadota bacterium]MBU1686970.1 hypothetical protein [Pseudomonadota bacterium]
MIQFRFILTILLCLPLLFFTVNSTASHTLTFGEVIDNLDLKAQTKYHVKEYIKSLRGTEVSWKGEVTDVTGGRNKVRIMVANTDRPTVKGYNIVLTIYNDYDSAAANLKKGQIIKFSGALNNFKGGRNGGVIVFLDNARIK